MNQPVSNRTWRAMLSAVQTPALALALLAFLLGTAEILARNDLVRSHLPTPGIGSRSRFLETQLERLRISAARRGAVDCMVFGNSLPLFGFDPEVFSAAYYRRSGQRIRCFNFGVPGLTASGVGPLARILTEDYHPWLLIYAVTARDFTWSGEDPAVEGMPWVQYRLGVFSIDGWLADNSYAYRYSLMLRNWHSIADRVPASSFVSISPEGFLATDFSRPDGIARLDIFKSVVSRALAPGVLQAQAPGLNQFLDLRTEGRQLLMIEMPVHSSVAQWLMTNDIYTGALKQIRAKARRHRVPFWRKRSWQLIPDSGWADFSHLNVHGAEIFSRWLGERVAIAVRDGKLSPGVPPRPGR